MQGVQASYGEVWSRAFVIVTTLATGLAVGVTNHRAAAAPTSELLPENIEVSGLGGLNYRWLVAQDSFSETSVGALQSPANRIVTDSGVVIARDDCSHRSALARVDQGTASDYRFRDSDGLVTVDVADGVASIKAGPEAPVQQPGLEFSREYAAIEGSGVLRILFTIHNTTASPVTKSVTIVHDLSHQQTVEASSDGDGAPFDAMDRWIVFSDTATLCGGVPKTVDTLAFYGDGQPVVPMTAAGTFADIYSARFDGLVVPPGEQRHVLLFIAMYADVATALANASVFDNLLAGSPLLKGLTTSQLANIVNWDLMRPTLHLPFDDGLTPTADISNGNDGSLVGDAAFARRDLGRAVEDTAPIGANVDAVDFDGDGDFVVIPNNVVLNMPGSYSISAWIKPKVLGIEHNIMSKDNSINGRTNYNMRVGPQNRFDSYTTFDGSVSGYTLNVGALATCDPSGCGVRGTTVLEADTWYHLATTYDDTTKTIRIYVNGVLDGEAVFNTTASPQQNIENVQIGRRKAVQFGGPGSNAIIDDVRLYSYALEQQDIVELARDRGLVAHLPFDDGTSPTANLADGHDGMLVGDAAFARQDHGAGAEAVAPIGGNVDALELPASASGLVAPNYVAVADDSALDREGSYSLAAWVSLDGLDHDAIVIGKETVEAQFPLATTNYNFGILANGKPYVGSKFVDPNPAIAHLAAGSATCNPNNPGGCLVRGAADFIDPDHPLGTWRHMVGVYDAVTKTFSIYLDGEKQGEATVAANSSALRVNDAEVRIGRRNSNPSFNFGQGQVAGRIDDARIYSRALGQAEIAALADDRGLLVHVPFDDGARPTADVAGGHDGTLVGDVDFSRQGRGGGLQGVPRTADNVDAVDIAGSGSDALAPNYVQIADDDTLDLSGNFSVAGWVKLRSSDFIASLLAKEKSEMQFPLARTNYSIGIRPSGPVYLAATFIDPAPGVANVVSGIGACNANNHGTCRVESEADFIDDEHPLGTWRHIAGTYDAMTKTLTLYLDGEKQAEASFSASSGALLVNADSLRIGRRNSNPSFNFGQGQVDGQVDDIRVYSRTLPANEVAALAKDASLVAHLPFDDGVSPTADISGHDNNGTLVNGAFFLGDAGLAAPIFGNVDAVGFNGSLAANDFVAIGDDASLDLDGGFTLTAWVFRTTAGTRHSVIGKDDAGNTEMNYNLLIVDQKLDLAISFEDLDASISASLGSTFHCNPRPSGRICALLGVTDVSPWEWHHVAARYDSLTRTVSLYLDGELDGEAAISVPSGKKAQLNDESVRIARRQAAALYGEGGLEGDIDDVRIYRRALEASEIVLLATDPDGDELAAAFDNCPTLYNPDQTDLNGDGFGDACVPVGTVFGDGVAVGSGLVVGEDSLLLDGVEIGDDATVGSGVTLGENTTYGDDLSVGDGTAIEHDTTVGDDVTLGADVVVQKSATIGDGVTVEDSAIVKQGATVGSGSALDALVQIGQNSVLGTGVSVGVGTIIRQCVIIGDDTTIGARVDIANNVTIESNVTVEDTVIIRQDALIGTGALLGAGVIVSKGAVIPPGAVVTTPVGKGSHSQDPELCS